MITAAIIISLLSLGVAGYALYHELHKPIPPRMVHSYRLCARCNRPVPRYMDEIEGPAECHMCKVRNNA